MPDSDGGIALEEINVHNTRGTHGDRVENQKLLPSNGNAVTQKICQQRSCVHHDDARQKTYVFFDYSTENEDLECLNWQKLQELRDDEQWGVFEHPLLLHYVNEALLANAPLYTIHILVHKFFLLLLLSKSIYDDDDVVWTDFFIVVYALAVICWTVYQCCLFGWSWIRRFRLASYLLAFIYVCSSLLRNDDGNHEFRLLVLTFSWINFLCVLRSSPVGSYILIIWQTIFSLGHLTLIWWPILLGFSAAFYISMTEADIKPWTKMSQNFHGNRTLSSAVLLFFRVIELEEILDKEKLEPIVLVFFFYLIAVVLLMNLMISLAFGEGKDLRKSARATLLRMKVNYVIDVLRLRAVWATHPVLRWLNNNRKTNDLLVVNWDKSYFTMMDEEQRFRHQICSEHNAANVAPANNPPSLRRMTAGNTTVVPAVLPVESETRSDSTISFINLTPPPGSLEDEGEQAVQTQPEQGQPVPYKPGSGENTPPPNAECLDFTDTAVPDAAPIGSQAHQEVAAVCQTYTRTERRPRKLPRLPAGIKVPNVKDNSSCWDSYSRWLIGLEMATYLACDK
ncbi:unnamed protein product, partial [Mesorhabditis spiculigera]